MRYLTGLLVAMKNVERGVLRQEICASLKDVFANILNPDNAPKKREWLAFLTRAKGVSEFWDTYNKIYETVAKWSKKTKHAIFCYDLLWKMCVLHQDFAWYSKKDRVDIFKLLVEGLKKDEWRNACLKQLGSFLRYVRIPLPSVLHAVLAARCHPSH